MSGKTVKLYLAEGTSSGIMTAEVMNWTGKATVCPRSRLSDLAKRDEVKKTGIYFLIGEDLDNPTQDIVYIGESDNVLDRLKKHNSDPEKEFWTRTVIFTSKDDNLTKGHVRYLESCLIKIVSDAKRVKLGNGTNPEFAILPESDIADMDYFIEQIKLVLPILGLTFAMPLSSLSKVLLVEEDEEINIESPIFKMIYAGVEAFAQEINGEFIVFKDSTVRSQPTPTLSNGIRQMRQQMFDNGNLADNGQGNWIVTQNIPFNSPSSAAKFVGGASLNGRITWKIENSDDTYAQWQESMLNNIPN